MNTDARKHALLKLEAGEALTRADAYQSIAEMLSDGQNDALNAAYLTRLGDRGYSADILTGAAEALQEAAMPIAIRGDCIDTCGTGGSGLSTINTSTLSAFVVAACGYPVVKHGNRSSTGRCGSMDVLERLGIPIDLDGAHATELFRAHGLVFLNARRFHPVLAALAPLRKSLPFRTIFNLLGPLANPARPSHQLIGVSDRSAAPLIAEAAGRLGARRVLVVHGSDGLDEITLAGPSHAWSFGLETPISRIELNELGLSPAAPEDFIGGDVGDNSERFVKLLKGEDTGPRATLLALNAGAALYVASVAPSIRAGIEQATGSLRSGAAWEKFEHYRESAQRRTTS